MLRRLALIVLVGCSSSSAAVLVTKLDAGAVAEVDAGSGSSSSSGDPGDEQGMPDEPLPECIATSIGIWDDFEAAPDGVSSEFAPAGTTNIGLDPVHHCGAQGIKVTVAAGGTKTLFVRSVPPPTPTPTATAVSWSFLVNFAMPDKTQTLRFAELLLANNHRLIFEFAQGNLSFVERNDGVLADGGVPETLHANLAPLALNEWQRIDMRLEYATKKATFKIGPPGGTAPTQEQTLAQPLDRVALEQLGATAPDVGAVTVHFDRAAVYVE